MLIPILEIAELYYSRFDQAYKLYQDDTLWPILEGTCVGFKRRGCLSDGILRV